MFAVSGRCESSVEPLEAVQQPPSGGMPAYGRQGEPGAAQHIASLPYTGLVQQLHKALADVSFQRSMDGGAGSVEPLFEVVPRQPLAMIGLDVGFDPIHIHTSASAPSFCHLLAHWMSPMACSQDNNRSVAFSKSKRARRNFTSPGAYGSPRGRCFRLIFSRVMLPLVHCFNHFNPETG